MALAYLGANLVHGDRHEEGMILLDESLAAVAGSEVDDFCVLEEIFCQLFSACEHAHDVGRADQWIRVGEAIAERRKLPAVSAFCRTHYGGILTAAGRWPEADVALTQAVRLWSLGQKSLRGGAVARLADLRVRQGRIEEAEQLLDGLDATSDAAVARTFAAVRLANGHTALARDIIERALAEIDAMSTTAAPLWALLVDVHLEAKMFDAAGVAADDLASCALAHGGDYLVAVAALARGRVCLASGEGDAQACLREALAGFGRAQMPVEVAHSRLQLAQALISERPEVAMSEARAALDAFDGLQAARHADEAVAVLRSLGVKATTARGPVKGSVGHLTKREGEVLELIGHGLSNPEIGDRLFISRKTVEHHVGNIFSKLGLRSRSQAAAYSAQDETGHAIGEFPDTPLGTSCHREPGALFEAYYEGDAVMIKPYDAIIVGARCAGAPTAMLLARKGYRVLVVDRASFPSDTVSTHVIHAPGIAALNRWDLLDEVTQTGCPAVKTYSYDFGPFSIVGAPRPIEGQSAAYAPRRAQLDKILVDAAARAGAEVREGFTVDDVIVEDGAVVGIRGRTAGGTRSGGASPRRDRCRRSELADRQGGRAGAVQRQADAAVELLHLLERSARGRLRDHDPARQRLGRGRHERRADDARRRLAVRRIVGVQGRCGGQLPQDARAVASVRRAHARRDA